MSVPACPMPPSVPTAAWFRVSTSAAASSTSVPTLHIRRSTCLSTVFCSSPSRICLPHSGVKKLHARSSSRSVALDLSRLEMAELLRFSRAFELRFSRCSVWFFSPSTSRIALAPSSPRRLSLRLSSSRLVLVRRALAMARPPSVWIWLSRRSMCAMMDLWSISFASARTPRSAILLWLRLRCVTLRLSTIPLATMRTLSSSSMLPLRSRCVSVSVFSRALARARQSVSFMPNRERS
mmetsp:Transcript_2289/g.8095  ORF Transcript_2289/g.8095 Transcript_2289/m.8095 type:complete len:237 (+) Transcript_2289:227-937(+)